MLPATGLVGERQRGALGHERQHAAGDGENLVAFTHPYQQGALLRHSPGRTVAARTITDAQVIDAVRGLAWTTNAAGKRVLAPEGLYGRRKMTALIRRAALPEASAGSVHRAMCTLGLQGIRRSKKVRTTIPDTDGRRAPDLLNRNFHASVPNRVWVTDFTYVRSWAGFVYVAFIVDVFAQRIDPPRRVWRVLLLGRMGPWLQGRRDGGIRRN